MGSQNADSVVLKEVGFDEPILELAPPRSRMMITPHVSTEYSLQAFNKKYDIREKRSIIVKDTTKRGKDTIVIYTVPPEPSSEKSDYVRGRQSIDSINKTSKLKYEIFFIDRSNYPREIKLFVSVKDENGNFITNLAPPFGSKETAKKYFMNLIDEVDGKNYMIEEPNIEESHDTLTQKYSFSLVLDHSGSMIGTIAPLQESVKKFISKMAVNDEASIVKFDHYISRVVPLTSNKNDLLMPYLYEGLLGFGGATALIAAADEGIRSISENKRQKIEVLFTDGIENCSFFAAVFSDKNYVFKPKNLIYEARDENVKIFTISFGNVDKDLLEKISILTDGKYYYANNGNEIENIFNELPRIFHNYYLITFKPKALDGEHTIKA
jgi:hypothetical protein